MGELSGRDLRREAFTTYRKLFWNILQFLITRNLYVINYDRYI